jgi:hypothetical protein
MNELEVGGLIALLGAYLFFVIGLAVFAIVCLWRVYEKAGKPGWACLVPIYNIVVLLEIIRKPVWWLILMLIPIVNIVILIKVYRELARAFGQGVGFTLGLIFVNIVFIALLAFGNFEYVYGKSGDGAELA